MNLPTIKEVKKWSRALRSGKYDQGFGELQGERGYCCLGVGCVVFIPKKLHRLNDHKMLVGGFPDDQTNAPKWLRYINGDIDEKIGKAFSDLNDEDGFSFDEIADVLELVYLYNRDTDFTIID